MTTERFSNLNRRHTAFARAMSFVLLAFIVYGTTIEAAHKHSGVINLDRGTTSSFTGPTSDDAIAGNPAGCSDCLICQLHNSFSSTATPHWYDSPLIQQQKSFARLNAPFVSSRVNATRTGRAPPFIS